MVYEINRSRPKIEPSQISNIWEDLTVIADFFSLALQILLVAERRANSVEWSGLKPNGFSTRLYTTQANQWAIENESFNDV